VLLVSLPGEQKHLSFILYFSLFDSVQLILKLFIDMWAVGCIFAELLTLKPLFQGVEAKNTPNPFQVWALSLK
jgi:hypothetical protein